MWRLKTETVSIYQELQTCNLVTLQKCIKIFHSPYDKSAKSGKDVEEYFCCLAEVLLVSIDFVYIKQFKSYVVTNPYHWIRYFRYTRWVTTYRPHLLLPMSKKVCITLYLILQFTWCNIEPWNHCILILFNHMLLYKTHSNKDEKYLKIFEQNVDAFFLVVMGCIVFLMQAGFAFLEAGSVRWANIKIYKTQCW